MDVYNAIKTRRSIRKYTSRPVEDEKINKLLESARLAPSAKNLQNWNFILVKEPEKLRKLAIACNNQMFIASASIVIAGIADPKRKWYQLDMGIAFDHIDLQATEIGLGACWIGAFNESKVSQILNVPDNLETVILITIGYPDESPNPRPRKNIEEIVISEGF